MAPSGLRAGNSSDNGYGNPDKREEATYGVMFIPVNFIGGISIKEQPTHMDRTITTFHEYRLRYPGSARIPRLTQSGLLGLLPHRQDLKAASLARRRTVWRRICAFPRNACAGIRRGIRTPELRPVGRDDVVARDRP